jgi:hypothetical protein
MSTKESNILAKQIYQIDKLNQNIEMGFYTKGEALTLLRNKRNEIANSYEVGSDNFIMCINFLIDANEIALSL